MPVSALLTAVADAAASKVRLPGTKQSRRSRRFAVDATAVAVEDTAADAHPCRYGSTTLHRCWPEPRVRQMRVSAFVRKRLAGPCGHVESVRLSIDCETPGAGSLIGAPELRATFLGRGRMAHHETVTIAPRSARRRRRCRADPTAARFAPSSEVARKRRPTGSSGGSNASGHRRVYRHGRGFGATVGPAAT
jgi:hypothetical protein